MSDTVAATKVFVGNLPFSVDSEALEALFAPNYPSVTDAKIISRRGKSMGYGFVTFENAEEASAAVNELDGHAIEDRSINCEVARPRDEEATSRPAGRRRRKAAGGRQRRPRDPDAWDGDVPRQPSTQAIFVANIPFSFEEDQQFLELFADYNPVQAHLVRPRHGGRPKGFGFVRFSSHEDQLAAIEGMHDAEIAGRRIAVKPALSDNPYEKYIEDKTAAEAADAADAAEEEEEQKLNEE